MKVDWKYKHFEQELILHMPRARVLEAVASLKSEAFLGWQLVDTPDGFVARGYSAWHASIAAFHVEPVPEGTRVSVELQVERAALREYMLVDIGGYYNGQIRKWLAAISKQLGQPFPEPSSMGRSCIVGILVTTLTACILSVIAIPLDRILFPDISTQSPGPLTIIGSLVGMLLGILAFILFRSNKSAATRKS